MLPRSPTIKVLQAGTKAPTQITPGLATATRITPKRPSTPKPQRQLPRLPICGLIDWSWMFGDGAPKG